jgi:ribosome-binding factor A
MSRQRGEAGAAGYRHVRLQQIVEEEVAALLRDEVADPRLAGVIVTRVDLSVDYKNAKVRFVLPRDRNDTDRDATLRALAGATPFLRARLAEAVELKAVPQLRFTWDAVAAEAPDRP